VIARAATILGTDDPRRVEIERLSAMPPARPRGRFCGQAAHGASAGAGAAGGQWQRAGSGYQRSELTFVGSYFDGCGVEHLIFGLTPT
jgi:hypothetical protein